MQQLSKKAEERIQFNNWWVKNGHSLVSEEQKKANREHYQAWQRSLRSNRPLTDNQEYYRKIYLQSEHWSQLKSEKLKETPYCEHCEATHRLDVHHIRYKHLYDVVLEDLITLCRRCHRKEHRRLRSENARSSQSNRLFYKQGRTRLVPASGAAPDGRTNSVPREV